ncbi:MAG: zinc-ribbon domain-containing protein [Desulfovibrio sp.]|nr:zinc-ribbon domain-containing protein [Desulfovibrio sp.]
MEIICPSCRTRQQVDTARLPPGPATLPCKRCGKQFSLGSARSIAVMISKGGVGKTTTAVHLAAGLALNNFKTLLVDCDTQGQAAFMLGIRPNDGLASLILGDAPPDKAMLKARENLWLLSGGKSLAKVKRHITRKDYAGENTLAEALRPIERAFQFIILDTSPSWDSLTVNVLFYAQELLAPISLEVMTIQGLAEFLRNFASLRKHNPAVTLKYLLPVFLSKPSKNSQAILESLEKFYGKYLCTPIRYSPVLAEAPAYGMTVYEYAGRDGVVEDFRELLKDVLHQDDL